MDTLELNSKKGIKREVSTKKNHLISVFNSFEVNISDKNKKYFDKVPSLLAAWEQIVVFVSESSESPEPEFESLFLHTLRFVLRAADWRHVSNATKTHLKITLQRFIKVIKNSKKRSSILCQCDVLESVINEDPWGHPILQKIIRDEDIEELDDLIKYFHFENGKVIVVRLEMLLESKCEDWAARLAKYFLLTCNNTHPLEIDVSQNELDYINDIYFCSLYKTKTKTDLISEIKTFDLSDGLQLLKRYKKHDGVAGNFNDYCKNARVWKCSKKVIELISSTLLANAVLHDELLDSDALLNDLIQEWASIHSSSLNEVFSPMALEMIRKYVLIARSSKCIYPFCSFLINNCGGTEYDLDQVTRCLIRAINQNMNEIEQYRVSRDHEKLRLTYDQLSKGFVLISELFREHKNIYKECLLTSFSLTPSRECIQKLESFVESGSANDEKNKEDPSVKEESCDVENSDKTLVENIDGEKSSMIENHQENKPNSVSEKSAPILNEIFQNFGVAKADDVGEVKLNDSFKENENSETLKSSASAYFTEVERLKVDESIKTDMNSILRYQRYHALTWDVEWSELKANCEKYLEVFEQRGFDEVELKYLELDYNQFKNKPIDYDEYCGIEKGYEHYVVMSEDSEAELSPNRKSGVSSDESDFEEEYGRKKRKKIRGSDEDRRRRPKKKRVVPQPKLKFDPDEINDLEFRHFKVWRPGCEKDADSVASKRSKRYSSDDEIKAKKKRGRPRKFPVADEMSNGNNDCQSENQPPEIDPQTENQPPDDDGTKCENQSIKDEELLPSDDTVLENISNTKSSPNNLQMLRQFRITLPKTLTNEENMDPCKVHEDSTKAESDVIFSSNHVQGGILKICIPKCDDVNLLRCKNEEEDQHFKQKLKFLTDRNTSPEKNSDNSSRNENEVFKKPKPRSSATLHHPVKRFSILKQKNSKNQIKYEETVRSCEIRLPKISQSDVAEIMNGRSENSQDVTLQSSDNLLGVSSLNSTVVNKTIDNCKSAQNPVDLMSELDKELFSCFNEPFPEVSNDTITNSFESSDGIPNTTETLQHDSLVSSLPPTRTMSSSNTVVSSVSSQMPEPSVFPVKKPRTKRSTPRPKVSKPRAAPKNGLSMTSYPKMTPSPSLNDAIPGISVSAAAPPVTNTRLTVTTSPTATAASAINGSPFRSPVSSKAVSYFDSSGGKSYYTNSNVGPPNQQPILQSSSRIYGSNSVSSVSIPSNQSPVYQFSSYLSHSPSLDVQLRPSLSTMSPTTPRVSYAASSPMSSSSPETSYAAYSPLKNHQFSSPATVSNNSTTNVQAMHSPLCKPPKTNCKLRAALQSPTERNDVNLYNQTYTAKQPIKENNVAAVHQILGEYRETMNKFPELGHVPAPRKRSNNANGVKRQRRSKKEIQLTDVTIPESISMLDTTPYSEVKKNYKKSRGSSGVHVSPSDVNGARANQISGMHVSQGSLPTNHVMQSNQPNLNVPSNMMQKLPPYVSNRVSSQNYGVNELKNAVNSYMNTNHQHQHGVNRYSTNATSVNSYLMNSVQQQNMMCNTNVSNNVITNDSTLMNLDNMNIVKNIYPREQDYPTASSANSSCGMNNNSEYKMYDFSVNPITSNASQNTAIVNNGSNNSKNNAQLVNGGQGTNSTMLLGANSTNVNNELKTPFLYATVYNNEDSTEMNDPGVCISIPENAYSETYLENCLAMIENNSLLGQNEDLYTKHQNNDVAANAQNVQFLDGNNFLKQDNADYGNEVIINVGDIFYQNSNYAAEMTNYGT